MRQRNTIIFITILVIGIALPVYYTKKELSEKKHIRSIWQQYQSSHQLPPGKAIQVTLEENKAHIELESIPMNAHDAIAHGTVSLHKDGKDWKVDEVVWDREMPAIPAPTIDTVSVSTVDNAGESATQVVPVESSSFSGEESLAPELAIYLDRMASDNVADAVKAWKDLGLLYTSKQEFLANYRVALYDNRPIHFTLTQESWTGSDGKSTSYFAAKAQSPAESHRQVTIGYALRCHLWRLDDASSHNYPTFEAWWSDFETSNKLPAHR